MVVPISSILHQQIAAVCPIDGISIGDPNDKTTWRLDFTKDATTSQKKAAQNIIDAFDSAAAEAKQDLSVSAQALLAEADTTMLRVIEAVTLGTNALGNPDVATWVNYRRALRTIVKNGTGTLPAKPAYPAGT